MSEAHPLPGRTGELVAAWRAQGRSDETIRRWLGLSRAEAAMIGLGLPVAPAGEAKAADGEAQKAPAPPDGARLRALVRAVCAEEAVAVSALRGDVRDDPAAARAQALICLVGLEAGLTSPRIAAFLRRSPAAVRVTARRTRAKLPREADLRAACRRLRRRLPESLRARRRHAAAGSSHEGA